MDSNDNRSSSVDLESRYNFLSEDIYRRTTSSPESIPLLPVEDSPKKNNNEASASPSPKTNSRKAHPVLVNGSNNDKDKELFDELKAYIMQGAYESLLLKLLEHPEFHVDSQDETDQNFSLLHHAVKWRQVECVRLLVNDLMANPNIKAYNGFTPIHILVMSDCRCSSCSDKILRCLQILLETGEAHVDCEDDLGETPLYHAARNRLSRGASFLLSNGASINHWVNGTSVATLLAQYVPDVLKTEFDKRITIQERKEGEGVFRGLRLDFRLLLQDHSNPNYMEAGMEAFNLEKEQRHSNRLYSGGDDRSKELENLENLGTRKKEIRFRNSTQSHLTMASSSSFSSSSSHNSPGSRVTCAPCSCSSVEPKETELLNYLLKADLEAVEEVLDHPLVEAFVHLKWLSVRRLFFILRSLYLFLISLYTFYVFDTYVNATCFYKKGLPLDSFSPKVSEMGSIKEIFPRFPLAHGSTSPPYNDDIDNDIVGKATFGFFIPTHEGKGDRGYLFQSFAEYFKAHEMTCEPRLRTCVMAYLFSSFAIGVVLYELYKMFESWYDYFKEPLNYSWWILAFSMGLTLVPGLGFVAHSWLYPFAAFTLVYGWILLLAQVARIPYFGIFVGVFIKVLKEFCLLLFTFFPLLFAFALGFSVMVPQNEFFRFIPVAVLKVFMMMTGDIDFWGVFKGTWTDAQHQGHVYIPLFIIYSVYILMVTMVLMSLLLGLAVDNIQEVRREAALHRTVGLIKEIGIFESLLHKPSVYYCGCSRFLRRMFSITSLKYMNGPELITYPEDPNEQTFPDELRRKLVPYLVSSCCSLSQPELESRSRRKLNTKFAKNVNPGVNLNVNLSFPTATPMERESVKNVYEDEEEKLTTSLSSMIQLNRERRRKFFSFQPGLELEPTLSSSTTSTENKEQRKQDILYRDLALYKEVKLLLEQNESMKEKLEKLRRSLLNR